MVCGLDGVIIVLFVLIFPNLLLSQKVQLKKTSTPLASPSDAPSCDISANATNLCRNAFLRCYLSLSGLKCLPNNASGYFFSSFSSIQPNPPGLAALHGKCAKYSMPSDPSEAAFVKKAVFGATLQNDTLLTDASTIGNCKSGLFCDNGNVCQNLLSNNSTCSSANQCASGLCRIIGDSSLTKNSSSRDSNVGICVERLPTPQKTKDSGDNGSKVKPSATSASNDTPSLRPPRYGGRIAIYVVGATLIVVALVVLVSPVLCHRNRWSSYGFV